MDVVFLQDLKKHSDHHAGRWRIINKVNKGA